MRETTEPELELFDARVILVEDAGLRVAEVKQIALDRGEVRSVNDFRHR